MFTLESRVWSSSLINTPRQLMMFSCSATSPPTLQDRVGEDGGMDVSEDGIWDKRRGEWR